MKKIFTTKVVLGAFFALLMTISSVQVFAQAVTTASMSGVVLDEKGEALPGATIIAIHEPSGSRYGASTRVDGRYAFPAVRLGGPYKITASFVGYKESVISGVVLTLGQDLRQNFKLITAETQLEEVKVSANKNSVINAGRTGAATGVTNRQLTTLPTLNRSITDFAKLDSRSNGLGFAGRSNSFNNITVDGAIFNNSFGLSGTLGGQTNSQPISLDAIEQVQISIAPYDVRQGSFTGAGINVVTKSGTNQIQGSVYYLTRNENFVGDKIGEVENKVLKFDQNIVGFRIGGPIVKNKLFFFANYEQDRRNDPVPGGWSALRDVATRGTAGISNASASELDRLSTFLKTKYNYDAGTYDGYSVPTNSDKATFKLDWNINDNNKFTVKYNYFVSNRDLNPSGSGGLTNGRGPGLQALPFTSSFYEINNNLNSVIAELNSTFRNKYANVFQAGFTSSRDFRNAKSTAFPLVDIGSGGTTGTTQLTTFGYEPFTAGNILNSDVFQISDNFTIFSGKNTFTLGTYNEFYSYENGFAPQFNSLYQFPSIDDFISSATQTPKAGATTISNPTLFQVRYSLVNGENLPLAKISAQQLGFYVQDEIAVRNNLKLTVGLRADIPSVTSVLEENKNVSGLNFRDGVKINTSRLPGGTVLWSPRVGFNWDVNDDKTTQVRGGVGVFTGRVPFVWISNQASNNGLLFGAESIVNATSLAQRPFNPSPDAYKTEKLKSQYQLAVTEDGFKFPQIFRANLAADKDLGNGWLVTLEGIYTKDLNAVYHDNVALPGSQFTSLGADKRPIFYSKTLSATGAVTAYVRTPTLFPTTTDSRTGKVTNPEVGTYNAAGGLVSGPAISDAIVMRNTSEGYSYTLTGEVKKVWDNGFSTGLSYTYTDARSVNDGGSVAASIWSGRAVSGDPNATALSYSNFLQRHRIVANGSYRQDVGKNLALTAGFIYTTGPAGRFSYTYAGDMNGDGINGNDLLYVPRDASEISLSDISTSGRVTYTAAKQWTDLDNYIKQDSYLSTRRGQYAERNGGELPWASQFDFKLVVDIKLGKNALQLSADVINAGNFVATSWGLNQSVIRSGLISFSRIDPVTGIPAFNVNPLVTGTDTPLINSFQNSVGLGSRWQGQLGIRYTFN